MPRNKYLNYLTTQISGLKPEIKPFPSPIKLLRELKLKQWLSFAVAFFAWTWDAFDFFSVTLVIPALSDSFGKSHWDIIWGGLTLPLMFRFVGAGVFGLAADRQGRRWPMMINIVFLMIFELTTGFCTTYSSFVACRVLFGISMGGIYGNAAATALEDCPKASRGLISGLFQSGYSFGFLLATVFKFALAEKTTHGWRLLFWFGACPPALILIARFFLPETDTYIERRAFRNSKRHVKSLAKEAEAAVKKHWTILGYLILFVAGLTFITHGSQDLYPLLLSDKYGYTAGRITVVSVTSNLGALVGGTSAGYISQVVGRRFVMVVVLFIGGALLYPYTHVSNNGIFAAVFFEQFCIQGALGIVPIHLVELAPADYRVFIVGFAYHLGILVSSPVDTIEARIGEHFPLPSTTNGGSSTSGAPRFDYGQVMAIFIGCAYLYSIIITAVGPERRGGNLRRDVDEIDNIDYEGAEDGSGSQKRSIDLVGV